MTGDQPQAVDKLVDGLNKGYKRQTLGRYRGGKTFTMANIVARGPEAHAGHVPQQDPGCPLYSEFKEFFPNNAVEYS
jgi:excinuclease ABC subunit B